MKKIFLALEKPSTNQEFSVIRAIKGQYDFLSVEIDENDFDYVYTPKFYGYEIQYVGDGSIGYCYPNLDTVVLFSNKLPRLGEIIDGTIFYPGPDHFTHGHKSSNIMSMNVVGRSDFGKVCYASDETSDYLVLVGT